MTRKTRYLTPLVLAAALASMGALTASGRPGPQSDNDAITRAEIGRFDRFLDTHPGIAEALSKNPYLIDDGAWVNSQPALQAFLQEHPEIRADLRTEPQIVMRDVARFNGFGARGGQLSVAQLKALDDFLIAHPDTAKQLETTPSLVDDRGFVNSHPGLMTFLQQHPEVARDWRDHPDQVIGEVARLNGTPPSTTAAGGTGSKGYDLDRAQVAAMASFLNAHPDTAKELEANPGLIDNQGFLNDHPELKAFLDAHPDLYRDWSAHPYIAINDLERFDATATARPGPLDRAQISALDGFLDSHPDVAKQLEADPSLIDNGEFLRDHPELTTFLQTHPDIAQDLRSNPEAVIKELAVATPAPSPTPTPKPKPPASGITAAEVETFDGFLENHPTIGEELRAHPTLISQSSFLSDNPDLEAFLGSHPEIADQLKADPSLFLSYAVKLHMETSARPVTDVRQPTEVRK
jgi:hypothetical protein